jgi:hypothetical protein
MIKHPQKTFLNFLFASSFAILIFTQSAKAQVAITLGAQESYDDNIFLEDGQKRPAFVVFDDSIEEEVQNGRLPILAEEIDGKKNDDLITNLSVGIAGISPFLDRYAKTIIQTQLSAFLFADQSSQNRFGLDGVIDSTLKEQFLPKPFYASLIHELHSAASDATTAQGTAARAVQTYTLSTKLGVQRVPIAKNTDYSLNYVGSYHLFLGELRFDKEEPGEIKEDGSDYHAHTAEAVLGKDVTKNLRASLNGTAGVQLFTSTASSTFSQEELAKEELDRTNYTGTVNLKYTPSKKLALNSAVGFSHSSRFEEPRPRRVTILDENNEARTISIERDKSETTLILRGDVKYTFASGSALLLGAEQGVGTDIDGERITTRTAFANGSQSLGDRLSLTLGGRLSQSSSTDDLSSSIDRVEATTSLNYALAQQISFQVGYNYVDQTADQKKLDDVLSLRSNDYRSNRVFVGINMGFVGLPL